MFLLPNKFLSQFKQTLRNVTQRSLPPSDTTVVQGSGLCYSSVSELCSPAGPFCLRPHKPISMQPPGRASVPADAAFVPSTNNVKVGQPSPHAGSPVCRPTEFACCRPLRVKCGPAQVRPSSTSYYTRTRAWFAVMSQDFTLLLSKPLEL